MKKAIDGSKGESGLQLNRAVRLSIKPNTVKDRHLSGKKSSRGKKRAR